MTKSSAEIFEDWPLRQMISDVKSSVKTMSSFSQIFRKNGGDPPAGPVGTEDLERGLGCPQNASTGDFIADSGPQTRSTSIYSTSSHRSPSPTSPFDPNKHGQALRRLETHGSLKTIPSGQEDVVAPNRTSVSLSEMGRVVFGEDDALGLPDSLLQQPESLTSADPYQTADKQSKADVSSPLTQHLPNPVYQSAVLSQEDSDEAANLPDPPKLKDGQSPREALPSFVFPLPNAEADNSTQITKQALYRGQISPKPHQALSSQLFSGQPISAGASPDLWSQNLNSEGITENATTGGIVGKHGTQGDELLEDMAAYEAEGEDNEQRPIGHPIPKRVNPAHTFVQSPTSKDIDEYLWSPAPSDDGLEAPSAPHMPVAYHAPSNAVRALSTSGLTMDSHNGSVLSYGNEHTPSRSSSSGNPRVRDSPLPHIDVLIPAGNIDLESHSHFLSSSQPASTTGSRESSSILCRYSGVITDGVSSRPMSDIELKEAVLNSLGDGARTGSSMLRSRDSSSQADRLANSEQIRGDHKPSDRSEASQLDRVQNLSADAGPGSSQTSSSLSTDRYGGEHSGHKARLGSHDGPPSFKTRCPTPPLLFGRNAISGPRISNAATRPALGSTLSRSDHNTKAVRPRETGRLPITLYSLGEQDWETISAKTEADVHAFDGIALDTKTGSSLADNSDSGSLSLLKETSNPFRGVKSRPVMQQPTQPQPRQNHSYMLIKNSQTGDLIQVPRYEYASRECLPNNNASARLVSRVRAESTYQHPPPLRVEHNHPLTSSPPILRFSTPPATSIDSHVVMQQNHLNLESSGSGLSDGVQEVKETQTQDRLYKTTQNEFRVRDPVVDQNQYVMESKEQSHQSSAWLSTVSEVASSEPSLPGNGGAFTKMMMRDEEGHVNGTLERGGNREVGSSLADASSLGANFSSSPVPLASSPIQFSNTPPSTGQGFHEQAIRDDLDYGSQRLLGNFHNSLARSSNREDSPILTTNTEDRSRSHSASGLRIDQRKPSPRRRRSSSESQCGLMDSPSAQKASALNVSSSDSHAQRTTSSGLLLRIPFSHSDDNNSQYDTNQPNVIERRGRQPTANEASIEDPTTPSSTTTPSSAQSRPFVRDGVLHTDVPPPIFYHPVYGLDCPWDRTRPVPARPRARPAPPGRPLIQRPVARAESPHLHRIIYPPTPELLERHELISRIYLIASMVIPPVALLYGHGYLDGVMQFHTAGEINGFRNPEKTIALCWGYGWSALCILAIVIAMIIISASG